jgi:hypothetical protein
MLTFKVGNCLIQNMWGKTPYSLFKFWSSYIQNFGEIQIKKQGQQHCLGRAPARREVARPRVADRRRPTLGGHAPRTFPTTSLPEAMRRPRSTPPDARSALVSYGPPWAHYLGGYQDRLLGGPLGLPVLLYTAPYGVGHEDYRGEVLG